MSLVIDANDVVIGQDCTVNLQFPDELPSFLAIIWAFVVFYVVGALEGSLLCATVLKAAQDGKFHWSNNHGWRVMG